VCVRARAHVRVVVGRACTFKYLNYWTDIYKFWLRYYGIRDHPCLEFLNFVPAVITWQTHEQETGVTLTT
jgi:hypothetical protein